MGFVGNYAPCGLSPQMYDMPVIHARGSAELMLDTPSLIIVLS